MNFLFTDDEIRAAVEGELTKKDWKVTGVSIDTRTIRKGELFIAINSKRDGHDFLSSAISNGAVAAIVTKIPSNLPNDFPFVVVEDSMKALNDLAGFSRKRYKGKLIAVTGSVGKTSTKAILTKVLSAFGKTYSSPKSFNNHLGVPLTLTNIPSSTQYVVCEIGMNSMGEIEPLSNLALPDIGIITNISFAHLAAFDGIMEIAREKSMICSGITKNGLLIFSNQAPFIETIMEEVNKKKVRFLTFGSNPNSHLLLKKTSFHRNKTSVNVIMQGSKDLNLELNALGYHHASNCLPVLGAIAEYNLDLNIAVKHLKSWSPLNGRGKFLNINFKKNSKDFEIKIIDESYNCNPTSLTASLEMVKHLSFNDEHIVKKKTIRNIAILGDMLELGIQERKFHREIAELDSINSFDLIHCVGILMEDLYQNLPPSKKGLIVKKPKDLMPYILSNIRDKDIYMVKGSNSIGLFSIVTELCNLDGETISR